MAGHARAAPPAKAPETPLVLPLDDDITPAEVNPPTNDDLEREYPPLAMLMNMGGTAVISCKATTEGRLDDCHLDSEEPAGLGFGAATVRASAYFTVKPARRGGTPVAAMVTIPLKWQMDPNAKIAPQPEAPLPPVSAASLSLARQTLILQDMKAHALANWQPWLDQQSAQLVQSGDAPVGPARAGCASPGPRRSDERPGGALRPHHRRSHERRRPACSGGLPGKPRGPGVDGGERPARGKREVRSVSQARHRGGSIASLPH